MAKQYTIRQGKNTHIETGRNNLIGGKESQELAKESETHLRPLLGVL